MNKHCLSYDVQTTNRPERSSSNYINSPLDVFFKTCDSLIIEYSL